MDRHLSVGGARNPETDDFFRGGWDRNRHRTTGSSLVTIGGCLVDYEFILLRLCIRDLYQSPVDPDRAQSCRFKWQPHPSCSLIRDAALFPYRSVHLHADVPNVIYVNFGQRNDRPILGWFMPFFPDLGSFGHASIAFDSTCRV